MEVWAQVSRFGFHLRALEGFAIEVGCEIDEKLGVRAF